MKNWMVILPMLLFAAACFTGCQTDSAAVRDKISEALVLDVSQGTELAVEDTHSGFHGDGILVVSLRFPDDAVQDSIAANNAWNPLPLRDDLAALVYGITEENSTTGPFLTDNSGEAILPEVESGYYYFLDRHAEAREDQTGEALLNRGSFNFTIALYDAEEDTLYYAEMDT